jgi:hypothetical protein
LLKSTAAGHDQATEGDIDGDAVQAFWLSAPWGIPECDRQFRPVMGSAYLLPGIEGTAEARAIPQQ